MLLNNSAKRGQKHFQVFGCIPKNVFGKYSLVFGCVPKNVLENPFLSRFSHFFRIQTNIITENQNI